LRKRTETYMREQVSSRALTWVLLGEKDVAEGAINVHKKKKKRGGGGGEWGVTVTKNNQTNSERKDSDHRGCGGEVGVWCGGASQRHTRPRLLRVGDPVHHAMPDPRQRGGRVRRVQKCRTGTG